MKRPISHFLVVSLFHIYSIYSVPLWSQPSNAHLIPNVAPPTPDAAQIAKYGVYPVSYFTGLADISIPLHEIQVGEMSVPIAIKYHASGLKVTDRAGWVGLGWSLQAGGSISRTVMGLADESNAGYFNSTTIKAPGTISPYNFSDLQYLYHVNIGIIDVEPDIYNYNIGSSSGKFLFNQGSNYAKVFVPYDPIKIVKQGGINDLTFDAYDLSGVNYKFSVTEKSSGIADNVSVNSAWLISKMISKEKQDTIEFSYTSSSGQTYVDISDVVTVDDLVDIPATQCPNTGGILQSNIGEYSIRTHAVYSTEQKLSLIKFNNGKIEFIHGEREDGWVGGFGTQKRLDQIKVYGIDQSNGLYRLLKTIKFYQSYFISDDGTNTKRLRLDSLHFLDLAGTIVQRYVFNYNTTISLPGYLSKSRDFWGYYNNKLNDVLVPRMTIPWQSSVSSTPIVHPTIGSAIPDGREPDPSYMQANILTSIIFPTGGKTEFEYETNRYQEGGVTKYAGGLRISKIKSYADLNQPPKVQTFKYGENESGFGRANFLLVNYLFENTKTVRVINFCDCYDAQKRTRTYVSAPNLSIEPYDGSPVVYPFVTVYEGDETENAGKSTFEFTDMPDQLLSTFAIGVPAIESYHWKRGLLTSSKIFMKTGTGYQLLRMTSNTYGAFYDSLKNIMGMKVSRVKVPSDDTFRGTYDACDVNDFDAFQYTYYGVRAGDNKLISTEETIYDQNNPAYFTTITTNYSYENYLHQQVTRTSTVDSKGQVVENTVKYPHESTGAVYSTMVQRHMLAYPVEEVTKVGGVQQQKIRRVYHQFSTNVIEPKEIYRQLQSGAEYLEVTMLAYDVNGNLLGYRARDGIDQSFSWAYKSALPVATVTGAAPNQVFYTSFEEETTGVGTGGYTGVRHKTTSYSKSLTGLTAGPYVLTYWRDTGTGWNLVITNVNVTGSTYTISVSAAKIDEVRFHPRDALMTTYTHMTGYGVTSVNDPNNLVSYYEYDSYGRLQAVRDLQNNILKTHQYNYKLSNQ